MKEAKGKTAQKARNIGLDVKMPEKECKDQHCPFHSPFPVTKRTFTGVVTSAKVHRSVTVAWNRRKFIPKYERYAKARTKIKAHNPPCIDAKLGDNVLIVQCRPISKTKNFVIVEKLEKP